MNALELPPRGAPWRKQVVERRVNTALTPVWRFPRSPFSVFYIYNCVCVGFSKTRTCRTYPYIQLENQQLSATEEDSPS